MTDLINGTTTAHGRTWPLYEHQAYSVEVEGHIEVGTGDNPEAVAAKVKAALADYGDVTVRVYPVLVLSMSPEDRAEKLALDEQVLARDSH